MIHTRLTLGLFLLAGCSVLALSGCGGAKEDEWSAKRPKTYKVQGKVTYNGQPVDGAIVSFQSTGTEVRGATGTTNASGEFQLRTFEANDGAVPGTHKVTVTKSVVSGGDPSYFDVDSPNYGKEPPPEAQPSTKHLVPEKYGSFETSGLTAEVKEGDSNPVVLELKD